jgi:hypothetical protein
MSMRSLPPRTQTGHRSPIGSAWPSVLYRRALHETFEMWHRQALLVIRSRLVRIAGVAQTERVCLGPAAVRSPGVQASLSIDRRRKPLRPDVAFEFASPTLWEVACPARHGLRAFPSLCWVCAEGERARTPARSIRSGRGHRAGGVMPAEVRHRPRSQNQKPPPRASRLVAQGAPSVASGLGLSVPAAGPARHPHYSCRGPLVYAVAAGWRDEQHAGRQGRGSVMRVG